MTNDLAQPRGRLGQFWRWLQGTLDKWRVLLLCFAVAFGVTLSVGLADVAVMWDEVNHLTGGLLLIRGDLLNYFLTSSFYPPMYNVVTAGYFVVGGVSVFAVRLVALTFAVLSIIAVFELAKKMYDQKTALLSAVLFAVTPGFIWLSRIALIETMLIFVFLVCMLYFFKWILTSQKRDLIISVVAFMIGAATKYQMIVLVPIIIVVGILAFGRSSFLKEQILRIFRYPRIIATAALSMVAAVIVVELWVRGYVAVMLYAIQTGTAQRALSSVTYPAPVFYLIETTSSTAGVQPVTLVLYLMGLAGLGFMLWRRKTADKFLLICFTTIYIVFSIVPNKEWRYIVLLFPLLAIASASLLSTAFGKLRKTWQTPTISVPKKRLTQIAAVVLIGFVSVSVFYSCVEAQTWVSAEPAALPFDQTAAYVKQTLQPNQTVAVACPLNLINNYLVWFYLNTDSPDIVWQYPEKAADAYKPDFNVTEFASYCQQNNTRFVLLYENDGVQYFETNWTASDLLTTLTASQQFTLQEAFGKAPNRIFVLTFQ
jgi:hypothetical protein